MQGIALGLPMPPSAGKRRLRMVVRLEDIVAVASPLTLKDARGSAPPGWQSTLGQVIDMAMRHGVQARVFGGLAWQALTGMDYLTASSDLDLLFPLRRDTDPRWLSAELEAIARIAPMRLDGEVVRADGAAVNWREIHAGAADVLVKTLGEVRLLPAGRFVADEVMA
jgi:phosphoribosyl-dephospho-CoA transferase